MFPDMAEILPEGAQGAARVERFTVEPGFWAWREGVRPGRYTRLLIDRELVMSDTQMERDLGREVATRAHGKVLIAGLGLGLVLTGILSKPQVEAVTVVERCQDVINLVAPHFPDAKLSVVCADICDWRPAGPELFDVIYFDIWSALCTDYLQQMATLHRRFARYLNRANPEHWMGSWARDELRALRRRERGL